MLSLLLKFSDSIAEKTKRLYREHQIIPSLFADTPKSLGLLGVTTNSSKNRNSDGHGALSSFNYLGRFFRVCT